MLKTRILIAGGSGLVGSRLTNYLPKDKFHVNILSRRKRNDHDNVSYYQWDTGKEEVDSDAFKDVSAIINLAGAGIADKRWTVERKKEILESRIASIDTLYKALAIGETKLPLYLGASAIGYYGDQADKVLTEKDNVGTGYLAEVTEKWEASNNRLEQLFDRSCILRIGIVLSTKGGALKELLKTSPLGMYAYFGNGKAFYSWIHIDDICSIVQQMIVSDAYNGIYNLTAPTPVSIKELVLSAKKAKGGFGLVMPVPEFALGLALGEMSKMLTFSTRVIPQRLTKQGYKFIHTNVEAAIRDLISNKY